MKTCLVDGCNKKHDAKGYCSTHYTRLMRHGNPTFEVKKVTPKGAGLEFLNSALKTQNLDCIQWPFAVDNNGYGLTSYLGKTARPHRVVCILAHGHPPKNKNHAAHSCGNKKCVNPSHLRWATPKENQNDKSAHGKMARGSKQGHAKLTESQVIEIKTMLELNGTAQTAIAKKFNVRPTTINQIKQGHNWKWLEVEL